MANYSLTTTQTENKSFSAVAAALEAALEAVDTTKTIYHYGIICRPDTGTFVGTVVFAT